MVETELARTIYFGKENEMDTKEQVKEVLERFAVYGVKPNQKMSMFEAITKVCDIADHFHLQVKQLQAELDTKNEALKYALRFLNPKDCDREYVRRALKGGE